MPENSPSTQISDREAKDERDAIRKALGETEAPTRDEIVHDEDEPREGQKPAPRPR